MPPAEGGPGDFRPVCVLRPSPVYRGTLLLLAGAALVAALLSTLAANLKFALLACICMLLLHTLQTENRRGLRYLAFDARAADRLVLRFADGRHYQAAYAGFALLGSLAVFVYVERRGWRRLFGPQRCVVLRDATDPDNFRRLRARVRLS